MAPALEDGDYAVAQRLRPGRDIAVGDVVEIRHPDFGPIVKRVKELRFGDLRVEGQARSSLDSDQIGWIPRSRVTARLLWRVSPKGLSRISESRWTGPPFRERTPLNGGSAGAPARRGAGRRRR